MKKEMFIILAIVAMLTIPSAMAEIKIDSISTDPTYIEAGDEVDIYIKIHEDPSKGQLLTAAYRSDKDNILRQDPDTAYWVSIEPKDDLTTENIIFFEKKKPIGHLFIGESWTAPFKIKVKTSAPPASYKFDVTIIKTALTGTEGDVAASRETTFQVKGIPKFNIEATNAIALGSEGKIRINVKNVGGDSARHVTVGLNATTPFTPLDSSSVDVGIIKPGEVKTVVFPVSVDTSAMAKAYPVIVGLKHTNPSGTDLMDAYLIGVSVTGEPKIDVAIDDAGSLKAGATGDIIVSIVNSEYIDAKFLNLELIPGKDFKIKTTPKVYVGAVDSDDFETVDYTLKISNDVTAEEIPLTFKATYKKEGCSLDFEKEYVLNLPLTTEAELKEEAANGGYQDQAMMAVMVIPALIVAYLILWLLIKVLGAITRFLDRRIFNRQK
ncbi:MAG: hypothetical protein ABH950_06030 [Candidatus Altiarchaeota archaeon]